MAATAAEFIDLLEPKLSNIWHDSFDPVESKYAQVLNVRDMNKVTITEMEMGGFGALQTQAAGDEVQFDDPLTPRKKTYTYSVKALAYRVQEQLWRGDLYGEVERFERDLMRSAENDAEDSAWSLFRNAFGTTNTGFDGLALCSTAHTRMDGGTNQANNPATDEVLSVSGVHNGLTTIRKWKNHRGHPIRINPRRLIVPPDLAKTAYEIMDSPLHPETANNTKNVLVNRWNLQDPLISEWLTSTTAWFLVCDEHDLNFFWYFKPESGSRTVWETESIDRKVRQAYVVGFGRWEGVYGTDGVA